MGGGSELNSIPPSIPPKDSFEQGPHREHQEGPEAGPSRPTLTRRRSSLKQTNGRMGPNGSQKVVSWAMDQAWSDQMTAFAHVIGAAEAAEGELDVSRKRFQDEIAGVKDLRRNILNALERLKLETDRLQLEERVLREHEEKLTTSFERMQEKEHKYKDKVHAALEESKRVVCAAGNKREAEVIS